MLKSLTAISFLRGMARILRGRPHVAPELADNTLLQTIYRRRSIRCFRGDPIPDEVFSAILEAGRLAPSTVNLQTWSFSCFTPASWRETFGAGIPFKAARAVIVMGDTHRARAVLDVFPRSPLVEYTVAVMNASLAAMNMTIAAEALGVSSVMLSETGRSGLMDAGFLSERLALPKGVFPIMTIVFGYAAGPYPPMPPRLPLEVVCFEGRYRETDVQLMKQWMEALMAGYKAMRPWSSFERQVELYRRKIRQAEKDLQRMVLGKELG